MEEEQEQQQQQEQEEEQKPLRPTTRVASSSPTMRLSLPPVVVRGR